MKIIQTTWNNHGSIQIQDHGSAYVVSYPSKEHRGFNLERFFTKAIGSNAWNKARSFAASQKGEAS